MKRIFTLLILAFSVAACDKEDIAPVKKPASELPEHPWELKRKDDVKLVIKP
ncbi:MULTISPECIES: hypothetical protein [Olivibacter]|uniref:Uncharacterized protein n=1 Tax=Olivibacter jilunii TaxID=985016 RepID=A0ABW6B439_9SPHI